MAEQWIMELSSQFLFVRFPNTCFRFLTDAYESFSMFIRPKRNGRTVLSIFELLLHELQFNFHSSLMRTREKMGSTSLSVLMGYVFGWLGMGQRVSEMVQMLRPVLQHPCPIQLDDRFQTRWDQRELRMWSTTKIPVEETKRLSVDLLKRTWRRRRIRLLTELQRQWKWTPLRNKPSRCSSRGSERTCDTS